MAAAVRRGDTTPLELVEAAIARLEAVNPLINAVALPNYDRARLQARDGLSGPLAGVPILIKDYLDEAGLPATQGSRLLRAHVAAADAPYAVAIRDAGLVSIGRSTVPEFAGSVSTESLLTGATRNPWNPRHSVGGSSGGSAAAVAAGVVPVAHANDFAGSIRHAAAPCGLVGLKASRGRMRGDEDARKPTDMLVQGCVSRTVGDTAAWLAATEARGANAPHRPVGIVDAALDQGLRIGVRSGLVRNGAAPDEDVLRIFEQTVRLLERLGHRVLSQPLGFDGARATRDLLDFFQARVARGLRAMEQRLGRALTVEDIEPPTLGLMEAGLKIPDSRLVEAGAGVAEAGARHAAQFESIDVYLTPVFSQPPVEIGVFGPEQSWAERRDAMMDYGNWCWLDNVAGTPAISLPMGFSRSGLPIGLQFSAAVGGEALLLKLAYQLERRVGWPNQRPPLWAG